MKIALFLFFLIASSATKAQNLTPDGTLGYLIKSCEVAQSDSFDEVSNFLHATYCISYLNGILDTMRVFHDTSIHWKKELHPIVSDFCPPAEGLSSLSLVDIFLKYTKNHEITLNESARKHAIIALSKSSPCKIPNKK
jgi:hypothetical protein